MSGQKITVTSNQRFFRYLATAQAATAAYMFAHLTQGRLAQWGSGGSSTESSFKGTISQVCFTKKLEIGFVPLQIFEALAYKQAWPDSISLELLPSTGPPDATPLLTPIQLVMASIYEQSFLAYFENVRPLIDAKFGAIASWPSVLIFGKIVRDAFAHGGQIDVWSPSLRAKWNGIEYSAATNGRQVLYNDLSAADLTLLMIEIEEQL